jgi:hypothetical protein
MVALWTPDASSNCQAAARRAGRGHGEFGVIDPGHEPKSGQKPDETGHFRDF